VRLVLLYLCFTYSLAALAEFTPEQVSAKEYGRLLYERKCFEKAASFLEVSARAGDRESQYLIGKVIDKRDYKESSRARYWYEQAAYQGHMGAMIHLTKKKNRTCLIMNNCPASTKKPEEWYEIARELGKARARRGDGEAMFQLYMLTGEFHWLEKSAKAGFSHAQYWLAVQYRQGKGFFLIHQKRRAAVDMWVRASAETGYVPAMELLIRQMLARKNHQALSIWLERAATAGSPGALLSYSAMLAHLREDFRRPLNLVKAYGMTLVATRYPNEYVKSLAYKQLVVIAGKMSAREVEEGIRYADQWERSIPPMSGGSLSMIMSFDF
jgi:TPR repeat protein